MSVLTEADFERALTDLKADAIAINANHGFFGPNSIFWHVNKHAIPLSLGAGRALLLQIAHPWVNQGVEDHSDLYDHALKRLQRTAIAVQTLVYGNRSQAERMARILFKIHGRINGKIRFSNAFFNIDTPYAANTANALFWVYATLVESALTLFEKLMRPLLPSERQAYYMDCQKFASLFGIPKSMHPADWQAFYRYNESMWYGNELAVHEQTLKQMAVIFKPLHPALSPLMALMRNITAVLLPDPLRDAYGLTLPNNKDQFIERTRGWVKLSHSLAPDIIRYGSIYLEANRRIQLQPPGLLIRTMNWLLYQKTEIVS